MFVDVSGSSPGVAGYLSKDGIQRLKVLGSFMLVIHSENTHLALKISLFK